MWIEKVKDKKGKIAYKFSERYIDPKTGKRKKVSLTYKNKSRDTQKEALYALTQKIDERTNNDKLSKPGITLRQVIDEWQVLYKQRVKESTYVVTDRIFTAVKQDFSFDYYISSITRDDLSDWFEKLLYERDLSNSYVRAIRGKFYMIFSYALKKRYILSNPMEGLTIEYKRAPIEKLSEKLLSDEEYEDILKYAKTHNRRYAALIEWMYLTGMRYGEAAALSRNDIIETEEGTYAKITGTLMYQRRKFKDMKKSDTPKTSSSIRNVYLPRRALEILEELKEINAGIEKDFIFCSKSGTPIIHTSLNQYLRMIGEELGIEKQITSHILRHTHISKLAELGVPLHAIQKRVGHNDSSLTQRIYLHVTKKTEESMNSKLENL